MMNVPRRVRQLVAAFLAIFGLARAAGADELWIASTYQVDVGGFGIGSNVVWPATAIGSARFALAVPNNLQTFQSAKVLLIPHRPGGAATLNVIVCAAESGQAAAGNCTGPVPYAFTGVVNQLLEIDISTAVASTVGAPGLNNLAIVAYTTPTTGTDHLVGLRFAYTPTPPTGVATLAANTFTGTQTAPAFVGDGSGLTNLSAPSGVATLGPNIFGGTQTAPAFIGDGTGLTNVNASLLVGLSPAAFATAAHGHDVSQITNAATLSTNTFLGSQVIDAGNLDLDNSLNSMRGNITRNGQRFLHNFGEGNTFLGLNAGNFTTTGRWNTAIGHQVLTFNGTGVSNTAIGAQALERNTAGGGNAAIGLWALRENTTGSGNTAIGAEALRRNTTGAVNTALGFETMIENTTGSDNVATGHFALLNNRTGNGNTAIGRSALQNTTGHYNTALGREAGVYATGDFNVFIGANSAGVPGESNAMYLGTVGLQTKTLIAGIRGTSIGNAEVVVIDQDGRLGSVAAVPIGSNAVGTSEVVDHSLTADDLAPSSVTELAVAPNSVTPEKVAFSYAASATKGGAAVDVSCMSCISPSEVTFSPGLAVFDSAGVRAGTLVSANMVARQLDGRWYSYQVSAGGFPTPTSLNFFYATTDCSGDAYMGGAPDPLITFITIHGNSGTAFHPNSETITLNSSAMFKSRREYGPNDDPASPAVCSPFNPTITGIFGVAIPFELSRLGLTPPFRIGM